MDYTDYDVAVYPDGKIDFYTFLSNLDDLQDYFCEAHHETCQDCCCFIKDEDECSIDNVKDEIKNVIKDKEEKFKQLKKMGLTGPGKYYEL